MQSASVVSGLLEFEQHSGLTVDYEQGSSRPHRYWQWALGRGVLVVVVVVVCRNAQLPLGMSLYHQRAFAAVLCDGHLLGFSIRTSHSQ